MYLEVVVLSFDAVTMFSLWAILSLQDHLIPQQVAVAKVAITVPSWL